MRLTLYFCLLILPAFCFAQKSELGFNGGLGIVSVRNSTVVAFRPNVGASLGLTYRFNFAQHFAAYFNPQLEYRVRSVEIAITNQQGIVVGTFVSNQKNTAISLPLMFNYHYGDRFRLEINAGAFYNYTFLQSPIQTQFGFGINPILVTDATFKEDAGGLAGIGFSSHFSEYCYFHVELRGYFGMMQVGIPGTNFTRFENYYCIMSGFSFPINRRQ